MTPRPRSLLHMIFMTMLKSAVPHFHFHDILRIHTLFSHRHNREFLPPPILSNAGLLHALVNMLKSSSTISSLQLMLFFHSNGKWPLWTNNTSPKYVPATEGLCVAKFGGLSAPVSRATLALFSIFYIIIVSLTRRWLDYICFEV